MVDLVGLGWMGFRLIQVQLEVFGKWQFFLDVGGFFFGGIDPLSVDVRGKNMIYCIYTFGKIYILLYKLPKLLLTCVLFFYG